MRRLRDGQAVSLEVESLDTNLECLVVAVEGDQAILHPVYRAYSMRVPTTSTVAMLSFEHSSRLVMLRGCARREEATLMFAVTDRVMVPQRRRYARVEVALPVLLTPLDASGDPAGEPVESQTRDLSADGLLVAAEVSPDARGCASPWRCPTASPRWSPRPAWCARWRGAAGCASSGSRRRTGRG